MQIRIRAAESQKAINAFRESYAVTSMDFSDALATREYSTFGEFMHREAIEDTRPLYMEHDNNAAVVPCDSCCLGFATIDEALEVFTGHAPTDGLSNQFINQLLAPVPQEVAKKFVGGSLFQHRMAAKDCQRWYLPVEAEVLSYHLSGSESYPIHPHLYGCCSLNHFGSESDPSMPFTADYAVLNLIVSNKRVIYVLNSEAFGTVIVITLGSTFVDGAGKKSQHLEPGAVGTKGAEGGLFWFGGSSVLVLFEPGRIELAAELGQRSKQVTETRLKAGQLLGFSSKQRDDRADAGEAAAKEIAEAEHALKASEAMREMREARLKAEAAAAAEQEPAAPEEVAAKSPERICTKAEKAFLIHSSSDFNLGTWLRDQSLPPHYAEKLTAAGVSCEADLPKIGNSQLKEMGMFPMEVKLYRMLTQNIR
eukprot:TRINITY_DN1054_c0_g1_i1.p1 TRINITY_DN1054_c0_g1~~TRINITY_DN1054_c0_g1_i1.p1  ORF type:complete len:423 (-),score=113.24 TRINITY_DN1054_c0_g1_i1:139-1407(-)